MGMGEPQLAIFILITICNSKPKQDGFLWHILRQSKGMRKSLEEKGLLDIKLKEYFLHLSIMDCLGISNIHSSERTHIPILGSLRIDKWTYKTF
jgi:hypothetical protein